MTTWIGHRHPRMSPIILFILCRFKPLTGQCYSDGGIDLIR